MSHAGQAVYVRIHILRMSGNPTDGIDIDYLSDVGRASCFCPTCTTHQWQVRLISQDAMRFQASDE